MLHQISWAAYGLTVLLSAIFYYGYVGLRFYRTELQTAILRLSGRQPVLNTSNPGDLQLPEHMITGAAQPDDIDFVGPEELSFGPPDESGEQDHETALLASPAVTADVHLLGDFSEMIGETKTLIRVINESSESKENFEMLFRLIIQKYASLAGSAYENQVNEFLLNDGAAQFPFPLSLRELQSYWLTEKNLETT